jgi:hypothetical protein
MEVQVLHGAPLDLSALTVEQLQQPTLHVGPEYSETMTEQANGSNGVERTFSRPGENKLQTSLCSGGRDKLSGGSWLHHVTPGPPPVSIPTIISNVFNIFSNSYVILSTSPLQS